MRFSIYRYNPETDSKPVMEDYELEIPSGSDMMLLEALMLIKEKNPSLAFRRSCREGVCGSDGMNINGKNGLACITPVSTLKEPVVVRPSPGLPVVRDLVVDMTMFYNQYEKIKPYLINPTEPPEKERLQTPEE
ncbi:MAG: succinate dehydrogenase iron-sulfur subunit, partial [Enterobacterales bacterium]|nr:succinate dehydrogenase iron-sulfur subunit [Enterobacterales bacterium]